MRSRLGLVVGAVSLFSVGTLLAQQPQQQGAAKPAAHTTVQAQAKPSTQAPAKPAAAKPAAAPKWTVDQIKEAQEGLKRAKVYTGPVNGMFGPTTRRAIRAFQKEHKLAETGTLSDSLLTMLKAVP